MAAVDPFAEELRRRRGVEPEEAQADEAVNTEIAEARRSLEAIEGGREPTDGGESAAPPARMNAAPADTQTAQREEPGSGPDPFATELQRRRQTSERERSGSSDEGGILEQAGRDFVSGAKSFAGGALDVIGMPADLLNTALGAVGAPEIPGDSEDLRELASDYGVAYEWDEEPNTVGNRASRIMGGSAIPYAGLIGRGAQLARTGAAGGGFVDDAARTVATRPGPAAAAEGASIAGATAGGETAEWIMPESELAEALGELAGGFTPAAVTGGPTAQLAKWAGRKAKKGALSFTETGGKVRAADRMQRAAADPDAAAARVGGDDTLSEAPLSPARRSGDRRLLSIERSVAEADPEFDERLSRQLSEANRVTRRAATDLDGDPARARELLENRREHLLDTLDRRAAQAADEADEAIQRLDPDASPREISQAARSRVENALDDARRTETELWSSLDRDAPATLSTTRRTLRAELANRSRFDDPEDVPQWLTKAIDETESPILGPDGKPAGSEGVTFGDVHALRQRVGSALAEERAKPAPNRSKVRILSQTYDSLLDDMASAEGQGKALESALAYSRKLNQRFRQGTVGRLLGFERRGGPAVDPADTLRKIVGGQASGTQAREFLEAAPEARQDVANYLRAAFLSQATEEGTVNPRAARAFRRKHGEVLDQLPELKAELSDADRMARAAKRFKARAGNARRLAYNRNKSRAALYLDGAPGEEWDRVLRSKEPAKAARALRRKIGKDPKARQGLKSSFVETLMRRAEAGDVADDGTRFVSGRRFRRLLEDHEDVADALGFTDAERRRLERIATTFERMETRPRSGEPVMDDMPGEIASLIARLIGAKSGQRMADGMGSSLVMAQHFSQRMQRLLGRITRDKGREIIAASMDDPELFRALMTNAREHPEDARKAVQRINAWLVGQASQAARGEDSDPEGSTWRELQAEAKRRGLPAQGSRRELIERLDGAEAAP
ncbi:SAP domain-containing protein [Arhodomonas sp. SL1]|uniref:SAP domain-containing protein n=1 Tax=Arhodomonas sp. SL1 TaxID=3425691 RepID=UPI003F881F54